MEKTTIILIILSFMFFGCGVPQKEHDKLVKENNELKNELNDCKFGADKLLNKAKVFFENKEFDKSKNELLKLIEKHPSTKEASEGKIILATTETELTKIAKKQEKEKIARLKKEKADEAKRVKNEKNRIANATRKMRKKYDDINETTWYHDKSSPRYNNYNGFFAYFGKGDVGSPWLRLSIQYAADDWLFIEKYIIKVDGITYTITENKYGEIETDNGNGGIWEWLDRSVGASEYEIIKAVANGKKVKIRFVGKQYRKDKTITNRQKLALRNVLDAYEAMGGSIY